MNTQTYKYATIVLLIVVLVLGWMLLQKQPAAEGVGDATRSLSECRADLAEWIVANKNAASASAEARAELDGIIKDCQTAVGQAQE
jgi:hypothetical protein